MKFCSDCKHKYTMSQSPCTECKTFNKMESGNPAVALLEKIKAEIIEYHQIECNMNCDNCKYVGCVEGKDVVENIKIIEKHIAELKGE